ncbi:hypothetical protein [Blastococcus brunescens]|uniref:Uncharacterized protein n=1 Tax=Blastococcus brunescens TaxID=1564165 RepID=A0ABZ1B498_9ACTN|nr:hypothetical protein [Blastococcus sp. BMG 8361]WRL64643.1 hypothetical protein U6N30_02295 [Blastococcus sp. BMG 8361]
MSVLPDTPSGRDRDALFAVGGEAGRLMAAYDWASTPVGPVEQWPAALRFAVRTVLVSKFPMVLTWGPDYLQFYNDAYAPLIGAKHPAIGQDIRNTLAEGWDALGPPIEHAMETLDASWLPGLLLLLERSGYREETYFTVSHAPAFDDAGQVAGMHAVCTEVTGQILGERRQRLLHDLATEGGHLGNERETVTAMCRALEGNPSTCRSRRSTSPTGRTGATAGWRRWDASPTHCPTPPRGPMTCRPTSPVWASWAARSGTPSRRPSCCRWRRRTTRRRSGCSSSARVPTGHWTPSTGRSTSWWPGSSPAPWPTCGPSRRSVCGRSPWPSSTARRPRSSPT